MMSWPATFGLLVGLSAIGGLVIAALDLGSLAAAGVCGAVIVLVKVISRRPEYDGLPAPPAH